MDDGGLIGVKDLHGLRHVGLCVGLDLLLGEGRAGGVAAGGVADKRGAVADDERDLVSKVLELAHLTQGDGVAEVEVGAGGIHAQLDVERHPALKLLAKLVHGHDLHGARRDDLQLFFDWQQSSVLRVCSRVFADRACDRARTRIAQVAATRLPQEPVRQSTLPRAGRFLRATLRCALGQRIRNARHADEDKHQDGLVERVP